MTNRPYRIDDNGNLVWDWEINFDSNYTKCEKLIKRNVKDMARNGEKEKATYKCDFCKKRLNNRTYRFEKNGHKYLTCSSCKFIFQLLCDEVESDRFIIIRKILDKIMRYKRHCTICRYFDINNPRKCTRGMWTGVNKENQTGYAFTYANDQCKYFYRLKMNNKN